MAAAPAVLPPPAREAQRLGATIALSIVVHALLILGVGFAVKGDAPLVPTLEVIFSQTRTALTPKQADFLAAASQEGGGEHDRAQRPRDNPPAAGAGGQQPQRRRGSGPGAGAPDTGAAGTGCTADGTRAA